MFFFEPIRNFYGKFERPISSLSLVLGFLFNILTLKRVDTLWENIWILGHIFIVGLFIILIHMEESGKGDEKDTKKAHFWYVNILQFFFGGIFSTYLVFYFRSSDIFTTWPFIFLLVLAFWANEKFKRHYVRLSFQVSLFFLSIYSFMIFLVPVVLHQLGALIFILSGILSLILIVIFIRVLIFFTKNNLKESKKLILSVISGIFLVINILYFTNLIPPIPLSLKEAGVYHSIVKSGTNYKVAYENHGFIDYFKLYEDFTEVKGESVYAYSAVFSPNGLNVDIIHEWQFYNSVFKKWVTNSVIILPVTGGRDGGFRTYSVKYNLGVGLWRVNIKNTLGQTIGHLRFKIISSKTIPTLTEKII